MLSDYLRENSPLIKYTLTVPCLRLTSYVIGTALIKYKSFAPVKITVQRRRLRSIIRDLIFIACKHVKHAHDETLKFGRSSPWFDVYKKISISL